MRNRRRTKAISPLNGHVPTNGNRTFTWTADNLPASVTSGGVTESYTYDADGERVTRHSPALLHGPLTSSGKLRGAAASKGHWYSLS